MLDVAEVETMTADELRIHIFTESVDPTMTKLALVEFSTDVPSLERLKNSIKATESSKWYDVNTHKGYSKAATSHREKHCNKCDSRGHTSDNCWGLVQTAENITIEVNTPTGASTNPKILDLNKNLNMNLILIGT